MRQPHIYALTSALVLTTVLIFVVGGDPAPEPEPVRAAQVLAAEVGTTTTAMDLDFSDDATQPLVLTEVKVELTDDAVSRSTTTTTTTTSTTTTHHHHTTTTTTVPTAAPTTTQPPSPPTTFDGEYRADHESDFYGRINSLRASSGLAALARNGSLDAWARDWAKTMADSGSIKHSNIASLVPPWLAAAENVGRGGSVSRIFGLLEESSGHLSNMVGNYTAVGIAVLRDSSGLLWTVHVFTR